MQILEDFEEILRSDKLTIRNLEEIKLINTMCHHENCFDKVVFECKSCLGLLSCQHHICDHMLADKSVVHE